MNQATRTRASTILVATTLSTAIALALVVAPQRSSAQSGNGAPPPAASDKAGEHYKNIKVLKDIPASELVPAMNFMTAALGVDCDYCHVHELEKDEKREKETARRMLTMTLEINKQHFERETDVTCYTCHRGATRPVGTPVVQDESADRARGAESRSKEPSPTSDQIVARYIEAIGGADAIHKLTTRVAKGTRESTRIHGEFEETLQAPGKSLSILRTPQGEFRRACDGTEAWQKDAEGHISELGGSELAALKRSTNFLRLLDVAKGYSKLRVSGRDKIGDRAVLLVRAQAADGSGPARLWFDVEKGLLLRVVEFEQSPLGMTPTQLDFSDFREESGVKIPFGVRVSRPGATTTLRYSEIHFNAAVDASSFAKPVR